MHRPTTAAATALLLSSLACGFGGSEPDIAPPPDLPEVQPVAVQEAQLRVANLYTGLRDAGCDPEAALIDSPVVARVLRNTPYALAGRTFSSADLTALFTADGDWYEPAGEGLGLDEADLACVARLKAHEDRLRRSVCVEPASEAILVSDIEAWLWHADLGMSGMFSPKPYPPRVVPADPSFDACSGDKEVIDTDWRVVRYSFELEGVADAAEARAALSSPLYGDMPPNFGNITDEAVKQRFEAVVEGWFDAPVRRFRAVASGEDHMADTDEWFEGLEDMRCVGPAGFMDSRWVCAGIALP